MGVDKMAKSNINKEKRKYKFEKLKIRLDDLYIKSLNSPIYQKFIAISYNEDNRTDEKYSKYRPKIWRVIAGVIILMFGCLSMSYQILELLAPTMIHTFFSDLFFFDFPIIISILLLIFGVWMIASRPSMNHTHQIFTSLNRRDKYCFGNVFDIDDNESSKEYKYKEELRRIYDKMESIISPVFYISGEYLIFDDDQKRFNMLISTISYGKINIEMSVNALYNFYPFSLKDDSEIIEMFEAYTEIYPKLIDITRLWSSNLGMRKNRFIISSITKEQLDGIQEIGKILGIKDMIETYYCGIEVDDIIA